MESIPYEDDSQQDEKVICPKCKVKMRHVSRKWNDKLIWLLSLGKLRKSRYKCINCGLNLFK